MSALHALAAWALPALLVAADPASLRSKYQDQMQAGRTPAAAKTARQILELAEASSAPGSREIADAHWMLGKAIDPADPASTRHLRTSIDLRVALLGPTHPEIAADWLNLGLAHGRGGRMKDAVGAIESCIAALDAAEPPAEGVRGPSEQAIAGLTLRALDRILAIHVDSGDVAAARPQAERALALRTRWNGRDDDLTIAARRLLGILLIRLGDFAAALPLHEEQLSVVQSRHGENSLEAATAMGDVAGDLHGLGRVEPARDLLAKALAIRQQRLKRSDPLVVKFRDDLATLEKELAAR